MGALASGSIWLESTGRHSLMALHLTHEIPEQIATSRGFRAWHAGVPSAGLRSSGKGANRTILDRMFRRSGRSKRLFLPPRGAAGAGSLSGPFAIQAPAQGGSRPQMRKGLES
jgi:hypothetical protein